MSDPQTINIGFYQPPRGSDPGTWDLPMNANSGAEDSMFGNVATISLTNAPVTLTTPPNSGAAWSGPYQSQSALLKFTGALTANVPVTIPRAGFFIAWNLCTSGGIPAGGLSSTFYVQLTTGAVGGNVIGIPPGQKVHVFSDGTNMDFVDLGPPGSRLDLFGITAIPSWITACTVLPYLLRDGSNYLNTAYPTLAGILGNTFGGTPGLNFNVPDANARIEVPYDTTGTARLTTAISGVNGQTMGSNGGSQSLTAHTHPVSIPAGQGSHQHGPGAGGGYWNTGGTPQLGTSGALFQASTSGATAFQTIPAMSGTANSTGAGASQNVQPTIVDFLALIKT